MKFSIPFNQLTICLLAILISGKTLSQTATVTIHEDPRIPSLLALKKSLEKTHKFTEGFTIQLCYGNLNKANAVLGNYRSKYEKWPASIEYETPNYKVWVGNFTSRMEADRALIDVQRNFPTAFILRPGKNKKE